MDRRLVTSAISGACFFTSSITEQRKWSSFAGTMAWSAVLIDDRRDIVRERQGRCGVGCGGKENSQCRCEPHDPRLHLRF